MKVDSIKEAANLISAQITNILIIEAKDEYNRQMLFVRLMQEIKNLSDKNDLPIKFYYWDEYKKFRRMKPVNDEEIINFKTLNKIFNFEEVVIEKPSPDSILEKMETAISVAPAYFQFVIDDGAFLKGKGVGFVKTFLRNLYNIRDEKLTAKQFSDPLYDNTVNREKLNYKNNSIFVILTNNLEDFHDVDDIAILLKQSSNDEILMNKALEHLKKKITFIDDEFLIEIKNLVKPLNLTQVVNFALLLRRETVKDKDEVIAFTKNYLIKCLTDEEVLEKLDTDHGFEQIGGFQDVKDRIRKHVVNVWKNKDKAEKLGLNFDSALLFFGAPGTGKTIFSSCLAHELKIPGYKFNVAKVLDKFVGESEKNLQRVFDIVEQAAPCVLFIDEIDSVGTSRDGGGTTAMSTHRVDRNLMNMLLQYVSNPNRKALLVGATNLIHHLDTALTRKGRFGTCIYIPYPDQKAREEILTIHLEKKRKIPHNVDVVEIAKLMENLSGAEIESVVNECATEVFLELNKKKMETEDLKTSFETNFQLPTARRADIEKYNYVAKMFSSFKIDGITNKDYGPKVGKIDPKRIPSFDDMSSN